jgi:hypothetical protein
VLVARNISRLQVLAWRAHSGVVAKTSTPAPLNDPEMYGKEAA